MNLAGFTHRLASRSGTKEAVHPNLKKNRFKGLVKIQYIAYYRIACNRHYNPYLSGKFLATGFFLNHFPVAMYSTHIIIYDSPKCKDKIQDFLFYTADSGACSGVLGDFLSLSANHVKSLARTQPNANSSTVYRIIASAISNTKPVLSDIA